MSDRAWWWHDGALSTSTGALSLALTCSAVRLAWAALPVLATFLPCSFAPLLTLLLLVPLPGWLLGCLLGYLFVCLLALYPPWLVCFLFAWLLASLFHHSCVKQLSNRQSSGEKLCSKTNTCVLKLGSTKKTNQKRSEHKDFLNPPLISFQASTIAVMVLPLFAPYLGILITLHFTAAAFCTSCHFLIKIKAAAQRKRKQIDQMLNLHL